MNRNTFLYSVFLISVFVLTLTAAREGFGYSMGTLVQLQTSHVPSSPQEITDEQEAYVRQVHHDLVDLTGSGL
jgi:hypothetical protein